MAIPYAKMKSLLVYTSGPWKVTCGAHVGNIQNEIHRCWSRGVKQIFQFQNSNSQKFSRGHIPRTARSE